MHSDLNILYQAIGLWILKVYLKNINYEYKNPRVSDDDDGGGGGV